MTREYYLNELSIDKQYEVNCAGQLEREIAHLYDIHSFLAQHGIQFFLNRNVLSRLMNATDTVEKAIESIEVGLAGFFWNWLGLWPHYESIQDEFGARVFHDSTEISDSGIAHPALHFWLNQSLIRRIFSFATSPNFNVDDLEFKILENGNEHAVNLQNLRTKTQVHDDIGIPIQAPKNWGEGIVSLSEKYKYVVFSSDIVKDLKIAPFNPNFFNSVDEKLGRLNEIVGTAVGLNQARRTGNDDLATQLKKTYDEMYQDMFAREDSPFSDESRSRKQEMPDRFKFRIFADQDKVTCFFHTKFDYQTSRLHFTWPISDTDSCTYVAYFGRKIV